MACPFHDGLAALEGDRGVEALAERAVAAARQDAPQGAQPHVPVQFGVTAARDIEGEFGRRGFLHVQPERVFGGPEGENIFQVYKVGHVVEAFAHGLSLLLGGADNRVAQGLGGYGLAMAGDQRVIDLAENIGLDPALLDNGYVGGGRGRGFFGRGWFVAAIHMPFRAVHSRVEHADQPQRAGGGAQDMGVVLVERVQHAGIDRMDLARGAVHDLAFPAHAVIGFEMMAVFEMQVLARMHMRLVQGKSHAVAGQQQTRALPAGARGKALRVPQFRNIAHDHAMSALGMNGTLLPS